MRLRRILRVIWKEIKGWFAKGEVKAQNLIVFTGDNRMRAVEAAVADPIAYSNEAQKAWTLDSDNLMRSLVDGKWYQIVGTRSTTPICMVQSNKQTEQQLEERINETFSQHALIALIDSGIATGKQFLVTAVIFISCVSVAGFIIAAGWKMMHG